MEVLLGNEINPEIGYFNHRKCRAGWSINRHTTDFIDVTYVTGGEAHYLINGKQIHVTQGDLLCLPVGTERCASANPRNPMECYAVNFKLLGTSEDSQKFSMPTVSKIGMHQDIVLLYEDLKNVWVRRHPGYMLKSKSLLLMILVRYYELSLLGDRPAVTDYRIEKAARYIVDHYAEDITIDTFADMTGLNPTYFGALFKETAGMTFRQFLTSIRLNHAETLLKFGNSAITDIAASCGFSDVSYFSRVYKKSRGIPPSKEIRYNAE